MKSTTKEVEQILKNADIFISAKQTKISRQPVSGEFLISQTRNLENSPYFTHNLGSCSVLTHI